MLITRFLEQDDLGSETSFHMGFKFHVLHANFIASFLPFKFALPFPNFLIHLIVL